MELKIKFLPNEYFWGGPVVEGTKMPINEHSTYEADFTSIFRNQLMPMFLSNKGRYVWSDKSFKVKVEDGMLHFEGETPFELYEGGNSLRDAYLAVMEKHFPFTDTRKNGKKLPRDFFKTAQYNTWMEFTYNPTQEGVLKYAHDIINHGFTPGILIIDEGWHTRYGLWKFDPYKFPNPKAMVDELHALGFKVMLWITPLVTADGPDYVQNFLPEFNPNGIKNLFLRNKAGDVALVRWWNGVSAILDFRKQEDRDYLDEKLQFLMSEYGVDGFKFDGGSYTMYRTGNIRNGEPADDHDTEELNVAWNEFGAKYTYHEYKDTFKGGGKATIQRLVDRNHTWDNDGIDTIIPSSILQGLFGHPFICPDMIGGGEWTYNFKPNFKVDEELFIRMAQASSLFPMMQFSWAPWRALKKDAFDIVLQSAELHKSFADEIITLIENAEQTGEPIIRNLEYNYPHQGYETITDEFMLGNDVLVCPIVTKGTLEKDVTIPQGKWRDSDGNTYDGGQTIRLATPLNKLLWFRKVND